MSTPVSFRWPIERTPRQLASYAGFVLVLMVAQAFLYAPLIDVFAAELPVTVRTTQMACSLVAFAAAIEMAERRIRRRNA